jgi:hypothetical protein
MKILLLSPNQIHRKNWTHQLFRNEFSKHHNVVYFGEGYQGYTTRPIRDVIHSTHYDCILTYGLKYTEPFTGLGEILYNLPYLNFP